MTAPTRPYHSPLRAEAARETRERILAATLAVFARTGAGGEPTVEAIAAEAAVERRTVFRHFGSVEGLYAAFFEWLDDRMGTETAPADPAALAAAPRHAFPRFDADEPAVRAAIHSAAGRAMRAAAIPARRAAFAAALAPATAGLDPDTRARVEALAHLLYSAPAWEVLKDYGGLTGAQAGEAAAWALSTILSAVAGGEDAADPSTDQPQDRS